MKMRGYPAVAGMLMLSAGIVSVSNYIDTKIKDHNISVMQKKAKSYGISEKDYNALKTRIDNGGFFGKTRVEKIVNWEEAIDSLEQDAKIKKVYRTLDSLKTDSACKKAYMEGAQMVRDSIKVASKMKK